MKKKINIQFILIAILAIGFTVASTSMVFYELFKKEVMKSLQTYAHVIIDSDSYNDIENKKELFLKDELRITLINSEGKVEFDTNADIGGMDNHKSRPEVEKAFKEGEGKAIRDSKTMDKSTFYYAVRLDDGNVLRVAKESNSMFSVYMSSFPAIAVIAVAFLMCCIMLSHFLTQSLMRPIEMMAGNMDDCSNISTYRELKPFLNTIQKQHEDIVKNAHMRQDFTANVSHELKTPLTAISGYSELIENGMADNKDIVRFAGEIHKSSNRLLSLINDIIRLSELDTMDRDVQFEDVNLKIIAKDCVETLKISAQKRKVNVRWEGDDAIVYANRQMMEELLYNLCDNAIRYNNEDGEVIVSTYVDIDKSVVSVKDTGIGIPKESQERIFERFYRVDKSRSKSTGGTGLGLAIVKHIVAQHKGAKIYLESESGKGTEIRVEFLKNS